MKHLHKIWKKFLFHAHRILGTKGHGVSILVPLHFSATDTQRIENWKWLESYWKKNLPGAEIIVGEDKDAGEIPFSKSVAVNDAASRAHGDIFIISDVDVYISVDSVLECIQEIRSAKKKGYKLWFIPYRNLFRLTESVSKLILQSNPGNPLKISYPVSEGLYSNTGSHQGTPVSKIGHWYGAMIQIVPREGFYSTGGWDEKFFGWGGEDHAAMVAVDTLYGPHKTLPGQVLHLWHPVFVPDSIDDSTGKKRLWTNQDSSQNNDALSGRYHWAKGNPERMRKLVSEPRTIVPKPKVKASEEVSS